MKSIFLTPLENSEQVRTLERYRRAYTKGDLEIPHDYNSCGGHVETSLAVKNGEIIASLTAIDAVVLDPLIKNPNASASDVFSALVKLETYLSHAAQKRSGAVDIYIAIPESEEDYLRLLKHYGYDVTVQRCVVLRRAMRPDTVPLLGAERDAAERVALQSSLNSPE